MANPFERNAKIGVGKIESEKTSGAPWGEREEGQLIERGVHQFALR
jgi:hypothetical protein